MQTSPEVAPSYDGSALDAQPLPTNDTNALSDPKGAPKPVVLAIVRTAAPQEPMERIRWGLPVGIVHASPARL